MIHSELSEALEEYRDGRGLNEIYYRCVVCEREYVSDSDIQHCVGYTGDYICKGELKPEGIPIELADTIIRILDYVGKEGIDIYGAIGARLTMNYGSFPEFITKCHAYLTYSQVTITYKLPNLTPYENYLKGVIEEIYNFSKENGIDKTQAIKNKQK